MVLDTEFAFSISCDAGSAYHAWVSAMRYSGATMARAYRAARRHGWGIGSVDRCPVCTGRGVGARDPQLIRLLGDPWEERRPTEDESE